LHDPHLIAARCQPCDQRAADRAITCHGNAFSVVVIEHVPAARYRMEMVPSSRQCV
jgi:hypothetical protein